MQVKDLAWGGVAMAMGAALTQGAVSTQSGMGAAGLAAVYVVLVLVLHDIDRPAAVEQGVDSDYQ